MSYSLPSLWVQFLCFGWTCNTECCCQANSSTGVCTNGCSSSILCHSTILTQRSVLTPFVEQSMLPCSKLWAHLFSPQGSFQVHGWICKCQIYLPHNARVVKVPSKSYELGAFNSCWTLPCKSVENGQIWCMLRQTHFRCIIVYTNSVRTVGCFSWIQCKENPHCVNTPHVVLA